MSEDLLALLPDGVHGAKLLLLAGALLAALLAVRRAQAQGLSPESLSNQLILGSLIGVPIAYGALVAQSGPAQSSYSGLLALLLALTLAVWWRELPLLRWLDIGAAPVLLGLAVGRLGSGLGAGAPLEPGLIFPFLWALGALCGLFWAERRHGARLRPGDSALLCGLLASAGPVAALGLALVTMGGSAAQRADLLSVGLFLSCGALLIWRRAPHAPAAIGGDESGRGGAGRGGLLRPRE